MWTVLSCHQRLLNRCSRSADEEAEPEEIEQITRDRVPVAEEEGHQRLLGTCVMGRHRPNRS
jgi:hypothetical protein